MGVHSPLAHQHPPAQYLLCGIHDHRSLTPTVPDTLRERKDVLNAWVSELVDSYEQLPLLLQFEVLVSE